MIDRTYSLVPGLEKQRTEWKDDAHCCWYLVANDIWFGNTMTKRRYAPDSKKYHCLVPSDKLHLVWSLGLE